MSEAPYPPVPPANGQQPAANPYAYAPQQRRQRPQTPTTQAVRHGIILGGVTYGVALVIALVIFLIMLTQTQAPQVMEAMYFIFGIANLALGGGITLNASAGGVPLAVGSLSLSLPFVTGLLIVALAVFFLVRALRQGKRFETTKTFLLTIVIAVITATGIDIILGLGFSPNMSANLPGPLANVVSGEARLGMSFAGVALSLLFVYLITVGLYQLYRLNPETPAQVWALRSREALPALGWLHTGAFVILTILYFVYTLVKGAPFGTTLVIFLLLAGFFFLAGPALLAGAPLIVQTPPEMLSSLLKAVSLPDVPGGTPHDADALAAISGISGQHASSKGSMATTIYSMLPGWAVLVVILATLGLLVAIAMYVGRSLPPAPMTRTALFVGVFTAAGMAAMLFCQFGLIATTPVTGRFQMIGVHLGTSAVIAFIGWALALELISRYSHEIAHAVEQGVTANAPATFQQPPAPGPSSPDVPAPGAPAPGPSAPGTSTQGTPAPGQSAPGSSPLGN